MWLSHALVFYIPKPAEIAEQDSSNFMGSLDIDSLFTNTALEETIEISTNNLFKIFFFFFVFFKSSDHLKGFQSYLNSCQLTWYSL